MSKNLFILSNNTHYLLAKKFLEKQPRANNILIVTLKEFENYKNFITQIREEGYFTTIHIIKSNSHLKVIGNIIYLNLISIKISKVENLFISSYYQWIQHYILSLINFKKIILLNDGANIFSIVELRKKTKDINFQITNPIFKKIIKLPEIKKLTYFSQFNLDLNSSSDSQINFTFKTNTKSPIDENLLFFIGGPLVESGILDEHYYMETLRTIKKKNEKKEIWYFAHRRESQLNLELYTKIFDKVIVNKLPFEEYLLSASKLPFEIYSFYSTVILNLFPIYPNILFSSIKIKEKELLIDDFKKNRIIKLYKDLELISYPNFKLIKNHG